MIIFMIDNMGLRDRPTHSGRLDEFSEDEPLATGRAPSAGPATSEEAL